MSNPQSTNIQKIALIINISCSISFIFENILN